MTIENTNAMQAQNNNQPAILEPTSSFSSALQQYRDTFKLAETISKSNIIPDTFKGDVGGVMMAMNMAFRLNLDPLLVMQNIYIVKGRPSFSGQFAIALIKRCSEFIRIDFEGDVNQGMRVVGTRADGSRAEGTWITPAMVDHEKWGDKWRSMPEQMFRYRSAAFFARAFCPDVLMGLSTLDELEDMPDKKKIMRHVGSSKGEYIPEAPLDPESDPVVEKSNDLF